MIRKIDYFWIVCSLISPLILIGLLVSYHFTAPSPSGPFTWFTGTLVDSLLILCILAYLLYSGFRRFGRWFPIAPAYEVTYTQSDWLSFQRLNWISALVFLGLSVIFWLLLKQAFLFLAQKAPGGTAAEIVLPIGPDFWNFPALTGGLSLATAVTYAIYRVQIKDRFHRFVSFHNQRFGFDQRKAGLVLVTCGAALTLGLGCIGLSVSLRIQPEEVIIARGFGLLQEHHPYPEILAIQPLQSSAPQTTELLGYVFIFSDSSQWSTQFFRSGPLTLRLFEALDTVSQRSGIPLKLQ
jgi:hypothetical protein